MNRKSKLIVIASLFVMGVGGIWWATKPNESSQANPRAMRQTMAKDGTPVAAAKVEKGSMVVYLTGLGSVTPSSMVTVTSRVEGQLMSLHFTEGQMVQKGQMLAQVDARSFRASLTQAQGQLAKDQAALNNARQDLTRYQTLAKQDSIAKQQVDAQAALVKQYEGSVKAGQGAIANAQLQLDYSRITAPISGRVGLRKIDAGNIVKANDTNGLVDIAKISPIDVIFTLPQSQLSTLLSRLQNEGEKPKVEVWDQGMKAKLGDGEVVTVDNQMDASTGTVKIKSTFDNKDLSLFPNQFVNIRMYVEELKDAILVPSEALQNGSVGDYVWIINKEGMANIRPIVKGFTNGTKTVIVQGLTEQETVIVDGVERLKEGAKVTAVDPQQAQKAATDAKAQKKTNKKPEQKK